MRLARLATAIICFLALSASTRAAEIGGFSPREISNLSAQEAKAVFSNQTILIVRPPDSSNYGLNRSILPVGARFVAYFDANGQILVWGSHQTQIHKGRWNVGNTGDQLCFQFPEGVPGCFFVAQNGGYFKDATPGNVLSLQAGAPVPAKLPFTSRIASILSSLGR